MELNWSKRLVDGLVNISKFRRDHGISIKVNIKAPRPCEVACTVKGNNDRIPIQIWLIHQLGFRFPISLLLKEVIANFCLTFMQVSMNFVQTVLAIKALMQKEEIPFFAKDILHMCNVVRPKREPGTNLLTRNHYLRLKNNKGIHQVIAWELRLRCFPRRVRLCFGKMEIPTWWWWAMGLPEMQRPHCGW